MPAEGISAHVIVKSCMYDFSTVLWLLQNSPAACLATLQGPSVCLSIAVASQWNTRGQQLESKSFFATPLLLNEINIGEEAA